MKKIILVIAFIMAFTIGGYAYSWPQLGDNERICLPMSTLHCEPIKSFIETYLIPLYKENKETYYVDRIYVQFYDLKNDGIRVSVLLFLQDRSNLNFYKEEGFIYSVTKICDVPVFLIGYKSCPYIELDESEEVCFDCYNGISIHDGSFDWGFLIKDDECKYIGINNSGASWLENTPMEKYIPGFRPIKRIESSTGIELMGNLKVSPPEYIYP